MTERSQWTVHVRNIWWPPRHVLLLFCHSVPSVWLARHYMLSVDNLRHFATAKE
jgi:hypothetical protein